MNGSGDKSGDGKGLFELGDKQEEGASGKARPKANQNWNVNNNDRLVSHSTSNGMPQTHLTVIWIVGSYQ